MQAIIFTCSECGTKLKVQAETGKRVKCPKCGKISALAGPPSHSAEPSAATPPIRVKAPAARPAPARPLSPQPTAAIPALEEMFSDEAGSQAAAGGVIDKSSGVIPSGRRRGRAQGGGFNSKKIWILAGAGSVAALVLVGSLLFFMLHGRSKPPAPPPVAAAAPAAVATAPAAAVPQPSQGWDLGYIPASATAVVGLRPAAILKAPLTQELLGNLGPLGQAALQQAEQQTGMPLSALDQVVAGVIIKPGNEPGFDFVTVIHTSTVVDRPKVLQSQGPATEVSFQGKSYHKVKAASQPYGAPGGPAFGQLPGSNAGSGGLTANLPGQPSGAAPAPGQTARQIPMGPPGVSMPPGGFPFAPGFAPTEVAIWFADDRTVVMGGESLVQGAIAQGPAPARLAPQLTETLSALGSSTHLTFVTKFDVVKEFVATLPMGVPGAPAGPPDQQSPEGWDKMEALGVCLSLSQQVELGLVGHCGSDSTTATQLQTTIAGWIQQAQTWVGTERQKIQGASRSSPPSGPMAQIEQQMRQSQLQSLSAVETLLKEMKNEVVGSQVRVRASMPSSAVSGLFGLAMSLANGPQGPPGISAPPSPPSQAVPGLPPPPQNGPPPGAAPAATNPPRAVPD